ncbi:lyase [Nitrosopumilus sp.]|uniref:lyase n=1 Tax=Nitrosopumilus sp. TaxID=2024843 RepID=UPI0034A05231
MKKKGVIVTAFFGFILLSSTVMITLPGLIPADDSPEITITGTPADNYPDEERPRRCGSSDAKSTDYVQEFSIQTDCTNPLAIVSDPDGNIWFAQSNTGNLAKFDPNTETFTEYENPSWPAGLQSTIWGIDYAPDGSLWFTDDTNDSIWKFSTIDEQYTRISYPSEGNSMPQKLKMNGSLIIVNDFYGNKITFLDPTQSADNVVYLSVPSPLVVNNTAPFTADFTVDKNDDVWYTNWLFQQGGVLVKFNQNEYFDSIANFEQTLPLHEFIDFYPFPRELGAPNGIVANNDSIWLADTTSSSLFNFDTVTNQFTQYSISDPLPNTFGNQTGVIKSPVSMPYWLDVDSQERIVFNTYAANNISVLDPKSQSLVEYHVPSKNPYWTDCDPGTGMMIDDCGIAQILDFTVDGEKIWFTEMAENNIGVVDTLVPLPLEIQFKSDSVTMAPGNSQDFEFVIASQSSQDLMDVSLILSSTGFLNVDVNSPQTFQLDADIPRLISATISASNDAVPGTYKVLLGAQLPDVAVSKYVTVTIE